MVHVPVPHSQAQRGWGRGWGWHRHVSLEHISEHNLHGEGVSVAHGQRSHLKKKSFRESRATPAGYTAEDNLKSQILLPPSMHRSQPQGMMGLQALLHHPCFMQC